MPEGMREYPTPIVAGCQSLIDAVSLATPAFARVFFLSFRAAARNRSSIIDMQEHVDDSAVFVFPLCFNRDSLHDGGLPLDLALKFQAAVLIDDSNENVPQESGKFARLCLLPGNLLHSSRTASCGLGRC
jgi:hypothetical protein